MLRDKRGQITIYLALVFFVMLGLGLCVLEGMRSYLGTALAEDALKGAGNYVLSHYDRALYQNYHVFFLDPRQKEKISAAGKEYLSEYLPSNSFFHFACGSLSVTEEKTAVEEGGLYLKHQIREWMKYRQTAKAGQALKMLLEETEGQRGMEEARQDMIEAESAADGADAKKDSGDKGEGKLPEEPGKPGTELAKAGLQWKTLKDILTQIMKGGILYYAVDDMGKISSLKIGGEDLPSGKADSGGKELWDSIRSFSGIGEWKKLLDALKETMPTISATMDDYYMMSYVSEYFRRYDHVTEGKYGLAYEAEYLVGGRMADEENLKLVANRIFGFRFAANYAYLAQSSEWRTVSHTLAGSLTGVLGFPQAEKAVQVLLTAAMSFGESLLDVHAIFSGEKVPLIKNRSTWNLTFDNAGILLKNKGPVKKGSPAVGYKEYLSLLFLCSGKEETRLFRMMDVMQMNTALEEPGFSMADSMFAFRWEAEFTDRRLFSFFPGTGVSADKDISFSMDRMNSY